MMNKQELAQQFSTAEFHKKVFRGLFGRGNRKFSLAAWVNAEKKGIADAVLLREATHNDFTYRVFAFSVKGDISAEEQIRLKEMVGQFSINQIRYESKSVPGFFNVYDKDGAFFQDDYEIMPLCRQLDGIYLVVVSETKLDELNCPYVAYTFNPDGSLYFWCVAQKYL